MNPVGRRWHGAACAIGTGILFLSSRDTGPFGPLVLVAPIPLLLYALAAERVWSIVAWSFVAGLLARFGLVQAYLTVFPPVVLVAWMCALPLWFVGIVLATRWVARNGPVWAALLSYPLFTTASEFLFSTLSPHGSFGALGYALTSILPLVQIASLGGVPALTFIAAVVPMAVVLILTRPRQWRRIAIGAGLPLIAVLLFGAVRLAQTYSGDAHVALAAIDALQDDELQSETQAISNAAAYADLVGRLAAERPDIILLPEKALIQKPEWIDIGGVLRAAADRFGIPVIAGFDETRSDGSHDNVAVVYRPGELSERYLKRHLIPGLEEAFNPGTDGLVIGNFGVAICKDMDFAPTIREYGRRDVRLMLVPAWDFRSDTDLHARMALVRGIEGGFAVARAAADGVLTVSDAYGRIVAERPTDSEHPVTLVADVGLISGWTVYNAVGDLFGWLSVVAMTLLVGHRLWRHQFGAVSVPNES